MKTVNKFYKKFEPMIKGYVTKIEISDRSIELCDVEQELKIKLYTAIIAYGKKWGHYRKTGKMKPIPIEFYIKTVLNNKMIDLYKQAKSRLTNAAVSCVCCGSTNVSKIGVSRSEYNKKKIFEYGCKECDNTFTPETSRNQLVSKEFDNMDMGANQISSDVRFLNKVVVIEGYDFLSGMSQIEKSCMCMFFKGYPTNKIAKVFKKHFDEGYNGVLQFIENTVQRYRANSEVNEITNEVFFNTIKVTYQRGEEY